MDPATSTYTFHEELFAALSSQQLHSSALFLGTFLVNSTAPVENKFRSLMQFAECLYQNEEYHRAILYYTRAVDTVANSLQMPTEYWDAVFQTGKCYLRIQQPQEALMFFLKIPAGIRTAAVLYAIATTYEKLGQRSKAIEVHKRILTTHCNMAFDCMLHLVALGVTTSEVLACVASSSPTTGASRGECMASLRDVNSKPSTPHLIKSSSAAVPLMFPLALFPPWLKHVLRGHELMRRQQFNESADKFLQLERTYGNNLHLLEYGARSLVYADDMPLAKSTFERILKVDKAYVSSLDTFASVLKKMNERCLLTEVTTTLLRIAPNRPEAWSAASILHSSSDNSRQEWPQTVAFLDKAIALDSRYWFGYIHKGWTLLRHEMAKEAMECFRRAKLIDDNVFAYTGIVRAKLALDDNDSATVTAMDCHIKYPKSAIALALLGHCLSRKDRDKAESLFHKALKRDKFSIDAIAGVTELLVLNRKTDEAIQMLEEHLQYGRHAEHLHTRLAEIYELREELGKAYTHYSTALSFNPRHELAQLGIEKLSKEREGLDGEEEEDDDEEDKFDDLDGPDMWPDDVGRLAEEEFEEEW